MKYFKIFFLVFTSTAFANTYEDVFPHYYEYCAGTMLHYQKKFFDGAKGGAGGHAFVYLHGICKDNTKDYPQVKICDPKDNHSGVGISLDSDYKNVSWVAIPGRDLMLNGEEERTTKITQKEIDSLIQKSIELKVFRNVELKKYPKGLEGVEKEKYTALFSIGTDIAVNWGRELRCVKVPTEQGKLQQTVTFLNQLNDKYFIEGKEYKWSMLSNNCTHLSINIGHELGINPSIKTDKFFLKQLSNLAIPANHYLYLMDKVVLNKKVTLSNQYSPNQFGAIASKYEAYPENEMFVTQDLKSFTLKPRKNLEKVFSSSKSYDSYLQKKEFTELKENALYWAKIYEEKEMADKLTNVLNFLNY